MAQKSSELASTERPRQSVKCRQLPALRISVKAIGTVGIEITCEGQAPEDLKATIVDNSKRVIAKLDARQLLAGHDEVLVEGSSGPFVMHFESGEEDLDITDLELDIACTHPIEVVCV